MDNQKVRAHLRKGELAVTQLEALGYHYDEKAFTPSKWVAPDSITDMKQVRQELQAILDKLTNSQTGACPVKIGDRFTIKTVPEGHFLRGRQYASVHYTVVETRFITPRSEDSRKLDGFSGWAISFDTQWCSTNRRLWLPLSCIKVKPDAGF